jgi:hypothetical protein
MNMLYDKDNGMPGDDNAQIFSHNNAMAHVIKLHFYPRRMNVNG